MTQATSVIPWRKPQEIEQLATRTREKHGCRSVPVDPYALATQMGVDVFQARFDDRGTAGAIRCRDGKPEILVREGDPSVRQAFTVAHELGHYLLHWKPCNSDEGGHETYVDSDLELYRHGPTPGDDRAETSTDASRDRHYREVQANMFAAALLMPEARVKQEWERERDKSGSVRNLARIFKVSPTAMQYRIEQLGLW